MYNQKDVTAGATNRYVYAKFILKVVTRCLILTKYWSIGMNKDNESRIDFSTKIFYGYNQITLIFCDW